MSGFTRVSISDSLRRTIQDIKEITGQHSDEDIYAMLKECNMDPNETAQKLLYLDTFHEVKRKRDRRKVRRGSRGGDHYSSYTSADAVGGRHVNARQENGYSSPLGRASKYSMAALHKESNKTPAVAGSTAPANGSTSVFSGNSIHELTSQLDERNIRGIVKDAKTDHDNVSKRLPSLWPVIVKQFPNLDPGPTPTSTPTNTSTIATKARIQGGSLKSKSSHLGNNVGSPSGSGLYSSATDPVLVPSLNPRNPGSVGIIKRETGNQRNAAEISANLLADSRMNAAQNVTIGQAVSGSVDLISNTQPIEYQGVERSQADSSRLPSPASHHIAAAKGNQETCSVQQVNAPSKEMSEATGVASVANLHCVPTAENPSSELATSEVDIKLHKLQISAKQSVIFPNHLHVPEAFKNALTFGSLEASLGQINKDTSPRDSSVPTSIEASKEPSAIPQSSLPLSGCSNYPDRLPSQPHVLVNLKPLQENVSSVTALRYNQSKKEMLQPVGGSNNPFIPPMPDHGPSLIPAAVGSHLVQLEGLEPQGGNSLAPSAGATPYMTQPRGIAQSSIAVSPQMFSYLRQTYPPNYIPYNPYFSQLYMHPQNAHQLLSHSGFLHQPSAGNIYMPPTAAASGVKFPIPPVYKPGNIAGNPTHFGTSGYGSYGASGLGYSSGAALPPRTSSNDDIAGPELKEKNMYSTIKQNEDLHVLASTSGRDTSALQTNVFYNLPQGQPVAFQPAHNSFPGIYHPTQSMPTPSLVQSLHQSQPTGGALESIVPPLSSYSQPQPQLQPLPQQQYGQMNWNQKL